MHKANSCLLFTTRLCENSRSEAQRCYLTLVPAKLWNFPITARIVFSPPAVPMPVKEKLLDERQRSWLRPNTRSWELMLGIRKTCKGNTLKSQPLQRAIRMTVLYYSSYATWNGGFFPPLWLPKKCKLPFRYKPGAATTVLYRCLVPVPPKGDCQNPRESWYGVNIKQGERSAAARGFCTPLNQVLTCKAFTGPFPSQTPAL